jgi:hypothetical protein
MPTLELKPAPKPVWNYYAALRQFNAPGVSHTAAQA